MATGRPTYGSLIPTRSGGDSSHGTTPSVSASVAGDPSYVEGSGSANWWDDPPVFTANKFHKKLSQRKPKGQQHRYEHVAMTMDTDRSNPLQTGAAGRTITPYQCCAFWPFTGPKSLPEFEVWENCVAICGADRVLVAKVTDEEPWTLLLEISIPNDDLYTLAWSFDPYLMRPIIAVGGESGLVYILDVEARTMHRILSGHGDVVLGLDFSPTHPHILASASGDKTTRIWNILGGDLAKAPPDVYYSKNYPMGLADEGDALVAILAGEGGGGHRAKVVGVAFHPAFQAIATCGEDHFVKIWALSPYPDPVPVEKPTPPGYRAKLIPFPIFSTNRIHTMNVDCIAWLSNDVLLSRGADDIRCWQWLGFDRFFRAGQVLAPDNLTIRDDYDRSHSFRIIANYNMSSLIGDHSIWYTRFGLHHAYNAEYDDPPWLVNGTLMAIGDKVDQNPGILLFNPLLAREPAPPPFLNEPRMPRSGESESEEEYDKMASASTGSSHKPSQPRKREIHPWHLVPTGYATASAKSPSLKGSTGMVRHCAISPRGAKWIVAVGEGQSIFVYQLKQL